MKETRPHWHFSKIFLVSMWKTRGERPTGRLLQDSKFQNNGSANSGSSSAGGEKERTDSNIIKEVDIVEVGI